jgi:phage gp16-like protein
MKALSGKKKKSQDDYHRQRHGLLAKVHIALNDLDIPDEDYRDILEKDFGVRSAAALSINELQDLVAFFKSKGWKGKPGKSASQALAFRTRAEKMALEIENGEKRLKGLVRKICGVERLEWCRDLETLKALLAALGKIKKEDED